MSVRSGLRLRAFCAAAVLAGVPFAAIAAPADGIPPFPRRDDALGRWLPADATGLEAWRRRQAARTPGLRVEFADSGDAPDSAGFVILEAITGPGTEFSYGDAGPPRARALYDPVHHVALYRQGCCAWGEVVLAGDVVPPPHRIAERNLRGVRTLRGVTLGMSAADVRRAYGAARLHALRAHPGETELSYFDAPRTQPTCMYFANFVFRHAALTEVESGSAC